MLTCMYPFRSNGLLDLSILLFFVSRSTYGDKYILHFKIIERCTLHLEINVAYSISSRSRLSCKTQLELCIPSAAAITFQLQPSVHYL